MTRRSRTLLAVALVAAVLLLSLRWLAQPPQVARVAMNRVGAALGLEITAKGASEYRLRGMPAIVLRDVAIRERGAAEALLTARRLEVAAPWPTLRSGGREPRFHRIEMDGPSLDLDALRRWRATRPPAEARLPTLTAGLRVREGRVRGKDWRIGGLALDLAELAADRPLHARVRGRYHDARMAVPFDLALSLTRPEALVMPVASGFAVNGRLAVERDPGWRMPAAIALSGPLCIDDTHGIRLRPARFGMGAILETDKERVPFALGALGPLGLDDGNLLLQPAWLVLRRRGHANSLVPEASARGSLMFGAQLRLQLDGLLAQWPRGWPALPPPIGQSDSPLPFALRYAGAPALTDVAALRLQRDRTRFDGRFQLPELLAWAGQARTGSPLPPLSGTLRSPRIEVAGATLEGVEVDLQDEASAP